MKPRPETLTPPTSISTRSFIDTLSSSSSTSSISAEATQTFPRFPVVNFIFAQLALLARDDDPSSRARGEYARARIMGQHTAAVARVGENAISGFARKTSALQGVKPGLPPLGLAFCPNAEFKKQAPFRLNSSGADFIIDDRSHESMSHQA